MHKICRFWNNFITVCVWHLTVFGGVTIFLMAFPGLWFGSGPSKADTFFCPVGADTNQSSGILEFRHAMKNTLQPPFKMLEQNAWWATQTIAVVAIKFWLLHIRCRFTSPIKSIVNVHRSELFLLNIQRYYFEYNDFDIKYVCGLLKIRVYSELVHLPQMSMYLS